MNGLINFVILLIIVFVIDMIWIQTFAKNKYKSMIRNIQGEEMKLNMKYATACYILIALLLLLVINKNFNYKELFFVGFCTYGIYDLTNGSIFNKWDGWFGLADMVWGGILFSSSGYIFRKLVK